MLKSPPIISLLPPRLACLAALSIAAAACTVEESSAPEPTVTSASTTTTVSQPDTTIPTTAAAPETTATSVPPTTAPPATLPPGPISASIPIVTGGELGGWLLLGRWQVDKWQPPTSDDDQLSAADLAGDPTLTVTGLDFSEQTVTIGASDEACFDGRQGPTLDVAIPSAEPPGFGYAAIALPASWPLKPRQVAQVSGGPPAYQQLGVDNFAEQGIDASAGTIDQIVVADLDGDGVDEALVSFEQVADPDATGSPGDATAILLVNTETQSSQIVIGSNVDSSETDFPITEQFRVLDVADLNGDGRMEVIVRAWYYEGMSVIVYEYDGTALVQTLATGCGA